MSDNVTVTFRVSNLSPRSFATIAACCKPALESEAAEALEVAMSCSGYSYTVSAAPETNSCDILFKLTGRATPAIQDLAPRVAALLARASGREVNIILSNNASWRFICKPPLNN